MKFDTVEQFKAFLRSHKEDVEEHLATEDEIKKLIEEEEEE